MKKNNEFLQAVLVWICASGVILALLVPCFSLIWRDRNRTHTRDECRLLAATVMCALVLRLQKPLWTDLPQKAMHAERREDADSEFYRERDGNLYTDRSAAGRWLDLNMPFQRQSADEKFRTLLCMLFLALLAGAWIIHRHRDAGELMDSAFTYLLQRNWRYGLNIYAITYALMQFCLIIAVGLILRRLILAAGSRLGNRGETIARLFGSFIAYASVIFAFARSLVFVGVNSTAMSSPPIMSS